MFQEFATFFEADFGFTAYERDALTIFRSLYQDRDFGNGLYRVFGNDELAQWKQNITEGYPEYTDCFDPFGYDWLGRCFAIDLRTKRQILLFDIGAAEVFEIPRDIVQFHNVEIPQYHEACLSTSAFAEWRSACKQKLEHTQCAGYKIPLFLGGEDAVSNLEVSDMEVYWHICSSVKNTRD